MCGSMVDIQFPTAENRRGKKKKEEETTGRTYNGLPYYIRRPVIMNADNEDDFSAPSCNKSESTCLTKRHAVVALESVPVRSL